MFEPHLLITKNTSLIFFYNDGTIISKDAEPQIVSLKFNNEQFRKVKLNDKTFFVYDKAIYNKDVLLARIRVSRSLAYLAVTLTNIKITIFLFTPLFIGVFIIIIIFLINKILVPIDKITKTVNAISEKNLSGRLNIPETEDEVGRLAKTFNQMLYKIENSFQKERQFTSNASHELRTPVTVIRTIAEEALKHNKEIKDYKKIIRNILKENKKMDYLISQLLFLARSDENNLNMELIDLKIIVEDVIHTFKNILIHKNIKISFEAEDSLKIKADQLLITHLLINLLNNSIKYNKSNGFIRIIIFKENNYVKITIEDNGIGIPEKDLPLIFNRFYKVDSARTSEGSGIGLSIVKWIVDSHKGSIEVKSIVGKGTLFDIKLPINTNI
ncbi:MAG: sensor histidine kinase [Candidatus Humimicrobiaceae bacterium]